VLDGKTIGSREELGELLRCCGYSFRYAGIVGLVHVFLLFFVVEGGERRTIRIC
jgi:hypothetical protein